MLILFTNEQTITIYSGIYLKSLCAIKQEILHYVHLFSINEMHINRKGLFHLKCVSEFNQQFITCQYYLGILSLPVTAIT